MEKELLNDASLDEKPIAYVRMYLDDLPLPCDEKQATICPLYPFIQNLSSRILIDKQRLKDTCRGIEGPNERLEENFEQNVWRAENFKV